MRGRCGSLLLTLLLPGCTSIYIWAVHASSPLAWNEHTQIDLTLVLDSRGRPAIPVQVHDQNILALLDSGAALPTMREDAAVALDLRTQKTSNVTRLDEDLQVTIGPATIDLSEVWIGHASADSQMAFGQELLSQAVVDMDFPNRRLSLIHPDAFTPPAADHISVGLRYSRPSVKFTIGDFDDVLCGTIDTGFDGGLALSPRIVEQLSLPTQPGKSVVYQGFGGRRKVASALMPLPEVTIAGHVFRDVTVVGAVPDESADCGNLIGAAIVSRQRVIFDLENRRLWFLQQDARQ